MSAQNRRAGAATEMSDGESRVVAESILQHQKRNCKSESDRLADSAVKAHSIFGLNSNWRFCIRGKENFLIQNRILEKALKYGLFLLIGHLT